MAPSQIDRDVAYVATQWTPVVHRLCAPRDRAAVWSIVCHNALRRDACFGALPRELVLRILAHTTVTLVLT